MGNNIVVVDDSVTVNIFISDISRHHFATIIELLLGTVADFFHNL